jgi:hypothetical protein
MATQFEKIKEELLELDKMGTQLFYSMNKECDCLDDQTVAKIKKMGWDFVSVKKEYQNWYTKAYRVISQLLPERTQEFESLYKGDPKRKEVTYMNYSISDYLIGLKTTDGLNRVVRERSDAISKMEIQSQIVSSARERFTSALFDIKEIVQADIFDSELETAKELNKKGFIRAGGAIAGVVLEKHLSHICTMHKLKSRKANPTISEYNQLLKDNDIINIASWRFIQHLGDIRNLCDHYKDREPTKEEVDEYITGIEKITKTVH